MSSGRSPTTPTADKHLNPVYEKDDGAKGFDVVLHDECSADVKDLTVIDRILKPHREDLPAVVLHCTMHSYRSEGWPKKVTPWFELPGSPRPATGPAADRRYLPRQGEPHHQALAGLDDHQRGALQQQPRQAVGHGQALAHGKQTFTDKKSGKQREDEFVTVWTNTYNGKTRVFGTTLGHNNGRATTRGTWTSSPAAFSGRSASSTTPICGRPRRCCWRIVFRPKEHAEKPALFHASL